MHKNRLIELTQMSGRSDRVGSRIKLPEKLQKDREEFGEIDVLIDRLLDNNEELVQLRKRYKKTADPQKQKQILSSVSKVTQENRSLMNKVEKSVKEINEKQKKDYQGGDKSHTLNVTRITQKASKAIIDFKDAQQKFSMGVKDNIRRQATIIQGNISEEEVEDIMANPEKGQDMLRAKLLNEPSVELQNAVSDIIDKYNDILLLQKTMHECLEMMQELALLVALTGEQLENIENTINQADDFTAHAQQKLVDAKKSHKSSRKKMCCIIMLLMGVIGAVLVPVLITKL